MQFIPLTCPKCGASMQAPEGEKSCFCTFCGTQLFIDDGTRTVTYRVVDEARVVEATARENVETKKIDAVFEMRNRNLKLAAGVLLAGLVVFGVSRIMGAIAGESNATAGIMVVGMLVAAYSLVIFNKAIGLDDSNKD